MGSIEPTSEQIGRIIADMGDGDGPIRMINLLGFAEEASYADPNESAIVDGPISGAQAYAIYGAAALPEVIAVGGSQFYSAGVHQMVIGPEDEQWDMVLIVEYPNRAAFIEMVSAPSYQAVAHHRTAALVDSRIIMTTGF